MADLRYGGVQSGIIGHTRELQAGGSQLPAKEVMSDEHVADGDFHIVGKPLPALGQLPVYGETKRKLRQYSVHSQTTPKADTELHAIDH